MKKSLLAIAAMTAFAGAAQAQSSVTVYGVADAGFASVSNTTGSNASKNNSTNGIQNGGLSSPRLGFKGTEDLGHGNKANFQLEAELLTSTGVADGVSNKGQTAASTSGQLFNRASWVGLSNVKWGEVRLGLQNTSGYNNVIEFDGLAGANMGGAVNTTGGTTVNVGSGDSFGNNFGRVNSSYSYATPKFMGLKASVMQGYKQQDAGVTLVTPNATNAANQRITDFGLRYEGVQNLVVAASYATLASSAGASNTQGGVAGTSMYGVYASYDFKVAKASAFRTNMKGQGVAGTSNSYNGLGVRVPVTPMITLGAQYTAISAGSTYTNANSNIIGLVAEYNMSKRTTLYALGAQSNNQANAKQAIVSSSKFTDSGVGSVGLNQTGYMLGMRHVF